jgi:hypothetical protein
VSRSCAVPVFGSTALWIECLIDPHLPCAGPEESLLGEPPDNPSCRRSHRAAVPCHRHDRLSCETPSRCPPSFFQCYGTLLMQSLLRRTNQSDSPTPSPPSTTMTSWVRCESWVLSMSTCLSAYRQSHLAGRAKLCAPTATSTRSSTNSRAPSVGRP